MRQSILSQQPADDAALHAFFDEKTQGNCGKVGNLIVPICPNLPLVTH